jgi:hypothetical protein
MSDINNVTDPLRRAVEILDKGIELGTFYNEIYKDKEKDRHLEFALFEKEMSRFYMGHFPNSTSYKLNQNGLYETELLRSTGNSVISFPGKYFYNPYGELHNPHGPAVITNQGAEMYFDYGKLHNENGPAVVFKGREKDFQVYIHYVNNKIHKEDGPAKEVWQDGKLYKSSYYVDGKLHRKDGPAIEWDDGQFIYALDGKKHKEDGPAVRLKVPGKENKFQEEYWVNGEQISYITFKMKQMREKFTSTNPSESKQQLK